MTVVISGMVGDGGGPHTITMIMIAGQVVPAILHMIALTTIIVFIGTASTIAKGHSP